MLPELKLVWDPYNGAANVSFFFLLLDVINFSPHLMPNAFGG
jgi:hypothetical protein